MSSFTAEDYERRREVIDGWEIGITSYRLGTLCYCKIDNVSPGAIFARGTGTTKAEAERSAMTHARARLATTRRRTVAPSA
jgi:hypothetical protein